MLLPLLQNNLLSGGAGDQTIDGALFTDADTFYAATVSATYTINGALFEDGDTFYAATVSQEGGDQTITGALYTDPDTFFGSTVSATYEVTGGLFTDGDTFPAATVSTAYTIAGSLFDDSDTFYAATVALEGGPQTINGALFANDNVFYAARVSGVTDTGGSGNRRRNINDDPDAFAELLKEWRERKRETPEPVATVLAKKVTAPEEPPDTEIWERLQRLEATLDRSIEAYHAAQERAKAAKEAKRTVAKAKEVQARQKAIEIAAEWERARLAYEAFLDDDDDFILMVA